MKRIDCLKILSPLIQEELVVVTLGVTKHEWEMIKHREGNCYLSGMGTTTPFGLGLALALPHRKVVVLDSDGSFLFGLNTLATLAVEKPRNLSIFIFDNECYESVGGSPSQTSRGVDLSGMARAAGIADARTVSDLDEFRKAAHNGVKESGLAFTVVKIEPWIVEVPTRYYHFLEERNRFVRYVERTENISVLRPSKIHRRDPSKWRPAR
jgi:thiamine pyrophosphate-dependent acetolactate synthase large subunit-like protein